MSEWEATRLVAARELKVKLRDRTFVISTLLYVFFVIGGTVLPSLIGGGPSSVAVADQAAADGLRKAGLSVRAVPDDRAAEQLVRDREVDAGVVGTTNPATVRVLALDQAPDDVVEALSTRPPVQLLDPAAVSPFLQVMVPLMFGLVFFMTTFAFGLQIAQSVIEEKQTRIVEVLVASVPVRALLAGKVLAVTVLALGQIALIAAATVVGLRLTDADTTLLSVLAPAIGWFIPFFVCGFLLLAGLWAVVGALASRAEEIGATSAPVQFMLMGPFLAVLFLHDNPTAMTILSYLPFSAPTAMPLRLFTGDAAGWEPALSLGILLAAAAALLTVSARLYEGSLLRTNGRTALRTAWRERGALG
ncbi:MAG TPA: ABC transporter permease [Catenuloplanes sp.]